MPPSSLPTIVDPAARERVVEVLSRHFANDVISMAELEARMDRVYRAANAAELSAIIADLPAVTDVTAPSAVQRITATLSGQEQQLTGVVPQRLELRSRLGYVELDLTRATFAPGVTEIDIRAFMGYVQIRLPAGVHAECLGTAMAGFFSLKGAVGTDNADAPSIVRITGRATFGFAECFVARRGADRLPGPEAPALPPTK